MKAQYRKKIASQKIKDAYQASLALNKDLISRIKSGRSKLDSIWELIAYPMNSGKATLS